MALGGQEQGKHKGSVCRETAREAGSSAGACCACAWHFYSVMFSAFRARPSFHFFLGYSCLLGLQPQTLISQHNSSPCSFSVFFPLSLVPSGYFLCSFVRSTDWKALCCLPQVSSFVYLCFVECSQISFQLPGRIYHVFSPCSVFSSAVPQAHTGTEHSSYPVGTCVLGTSFAYG